VSINTNIMLLDWILSPKRCVLKNQKDDGYVQKHNICTNVPSSQTFRSVFSNIIHILPTSSGNESNVTMGRDNIYIKLYLKNHLTGPMIWNNHKYLSLCKILRSNTEQLFTVTFMLSSPNSHFFW
jgi:hypothetical protein